MPSFLFAPNHMVVTVGQDGLVANTAKYATGLPILAVNPDPRRYDGQRLLAFNELFIGARSHRSARYKISYNGQEEEQSSSGILVCTAVGATGWLSSVFTMTEQVQRFCAPPAKHSSVAKPLRLSDNQLLYVTREPFVSKTSCANLSIGKIEANTAFSVESYMPDYGVIFSDGIESDFLQFRSGSLASIGLAAEKAHLVLSD